MLKNYFKTAFRSLLKNRAFSIINIMGLSIGLCAFLLIYTYVTFERSYDDFHNDADRLYRVTTVNDSGTKDAMAFSPEGKALKEDFPEVIAFSTSYKWDDIFTMRINDVLYVEKSVIAADNNFLQLFNYPILKGDNINPLKEPNSIVLTNSLAEKYFGKENPIGKLIQVNNETGKAFKVTAVIGDVPENTHYKFNLLISISTIKERTDDDGWGGNNYYTYIKVKEDADMVALSSKMPVFSKKYMGEESIDLAVFQPVQDIHLLSDYTYEPEIHGNAKIVNFLAIIAFAILVIAWVNYINLSTAKSMDRAKEVGMRKVVGASRKSLIYQFMSESLMINFISILLAVTMMQFAFPWFSGLMSNGNIINFWSIEGSHLLIISLFLISILLSGYYPALVMSSFKPISVISGKMKTSGRGVFLRKLLVIFQFSASMILIAGTLVVYTQIEFMRNKDLGVSLEQVLSMPVPNLNGSRQERRQAIETFQEQLMMTVGVVNVGNTSTLPDGGKSGVSSFDAGVYRVDDVAKDKSTNYAIWMNENYTETVGIKFLSGRNFDPKKASDSSAIILNESLMKKIGIIDVEEAIGMKIQIGKSLKAEKFNVVGVIKDYNRETLKNSVEPTVFFFNPRGSSGHLAIKLKSTSLSQTVKKVEALWMSHFPNAPFEYQFLDEAFDRAYKADKKFGVMFGVFAGLAIFIACLGLFGLSSFLAMQKTKEIGIRKVLGASVNGIVMLLYKNFFMLVVTAFVIGIPVIYLIMNSWLESYSYRIGFPWWVLVVSIISLLFISFLTVGFQTLKAALVNPAEALKCE